MRSFVWIVKVHSKSHSAINNLTRWSTWRLPTLFPVVTLLFMNRLDNELTWLQCVTTIQWKKTYYLHTAQNWLKNTHWSQVNSLSNLFIKSKVNIGKGSIDDKCFILSNYLYHYDSCFELLQFKQMIKSVIIMKI